MALTNTVSSSGRERALERSCISSGLRTSIKPISESRLRGARSDLLNFTAIVNVLSKDFLSFILTDYFALITFGLKACNDNNMNFQNQINFLKKLQKNNNKEWMDANRKWYKEVRDDYISWLDKMNAKLAAIDDEYYDTPGKKGINRINNNLMFHPNKPIYKDHFGAGLDKRPNTGDFYVEVGIERSMFAGGLWRPDPKRLRSIRDAIDYDGEELQKILNRTSFKSMFGGLYQDNRLTNAPKGFSNDHPHIDLLRNKTFAVAMEFSSEEVLQKDFDKKLISVYNEMLPFRRYLNQAVTV